MKRKITGVVCSVAAIIGIVQLDYSDEIRISQEGLKLIGNAEGCRTHPYKCPAGVLTVGIGNTTDVKEGKVYTLDEIAQRWVDDIKTAEQCVNQYGNGVKLPQPVFDAVTSITFNVGCIKMRASTMYSYLNNNEFTMACNEFPRWNKSNGRILPGLVERRHHEQLLCLTWRHEHEVKAIDGGDVNFDNGVRILAY